MSKDIVKEWERPSFEEEYTGEKEDQAFEELEEKIKKSENGDVIDITGKEEDVLVFMRKQVGGSHYQLAIEPIDYIVKNDIPYREANVIKYVTRHKSKNGAEDIKKAIHYLEMILEDYND